MKTNLTFLILAFAQIMIAQSFVESQQSIPFSGINISTIDFEDVDNDGDDDILITGKIEDDYVTKLYMNDGSGVFTEKEENSFIGAFHSSVVFMDIDGDSDSDVLIMGEVGNTPLDNGVSILDGLIKCSCRRVYI